jgi:hypothetical protein
MNELAQAIRQALSQSNWQKELLEIYRQADETIAAIHNSGATPKRFGLGGEDSRDTQLPAPPNKQRWGVAHGHEIRCLGGGCCCRFDLQEHRLYASTLELALLCLQQPANAGRAERDCCPYQEFTQCRAHALRPLGCRTFFCRDEQGVIQELHEPSHRRIVELHGQAGVAYRYAELCSALLQFFTSP